ncbi:hypothetical protein L3V77_22630 [Vibrio sp. DW001]|nr:hypothetical protein [Vibrio sp. DW001]WED28739.1 hypothetical protein L3V77_22630 [Vibrio sp. DW001]
MSFIYAHLDGIAIASVNLTVHMDKLSDLDLTTIYSKLICTANCAD